MIDYFVSYGIVVDDTPGFGCGSIALEGPVTGWGDIELFMDHIRRKIPEAGKVTILNWRRFEQAEKEEA